MVNLTISLPPSIAEEVELRGGPEWVASLVQIALSADLRKCENCRLAKPLSKYTKSVKLCDDCVRRMAAATEAKPEKPKLGRPPQDVPPGTKRCPACDTLKPVTDFYRDKARPGGYEAYCKICKRGHNQTNNAAYYAKHRERLIAKAQERKKAKWAERGG